MAGDWIRMRTDLYRDPKVILIADALMAPDSDLSRYINQHTRRDSNVTRNVMRNVTVGALVTVWGVARTQGKRVDDDALIANATISVVDDICDLPGFGEAMASVEWVVESDNGIVFPRFFEEYNADYDEQKAKNRERQRRYREAKKRNVTGDVTSRAREEKRREELKVLPNGNTLGGKSRKVTQDELQAAEPIYKAYPRHIAKPKALEAIAKALRRVPFDDLMAAVQEYAKSREGKDPNLTPYPASWFNAERWNDDRSEWHRPERPKPGERPPDAWRDIQAASPGDGPRTF